MENHWDMRFPSARRSLVTDREQNALRKGKAQLQDTGNIFIDFFFSLCGNSNTWSLMNDSRYFDISVTNPRRCQGETRKDKRKNKLFELIVSISLPNNAIWFWTQFKPPHLIFKVLKRLGPHHLSHHMTTFIFYHRSY